jgi:transcriptional regulator with XRE-family HTH domain
MAGGRPLKLNKIMKRKMRKLYLKGMTDLEVCEILDISESSLTNWKKKFPELLASLKDWKRHADDEVELSLFERAKGYTANETKILSYEGSHTDSVDIAKEYPPDVTACIFWLKNRRGKEWKDKHEIGTEDKKPININYKVIK